MAKYDLVKDKTWSGQRPTLALHWPETNPSSALVKRSISVWSEISSIAVLWSETKIAMLWSDTNLYWAFSSAFYTFRQLPTFRKYSWSTSGSTSDTPEVFLITPRQIRWVKMYFGDFRLPEALPEVLPEALPTLRKRPSLVITLWVILTSSRASCLSII